MQFIPGTWRVVGVDANGDGCKDPQNHRTPPRRPPSTCARALATSAPSRAALRRAALQPERRVCPAGARDRGGLPRWLTVIPGSDLSDSSATAPLPPSGEPQTMAYDPPSRLARPARRAAGRGPARPAAPARSGRARARPVRTAPTPGGGVVGAVGVRRGRGGWRHRSTVGARGPRRLRRAARAPRVHDPVPQPTCTILGPVVLRGRRLPLAAGVTTAAAVTSAAASLP